jgi:hypothetical protein
METYEAWMSPDGCEISFTTAENHRITRKRGLGPTQDWTLLHIIRAPDWESAMVEHHKAMNWEAYNPINEDSD